jgi:hypothetical protein
MKAGLEFEPFARSRFMKAYHVGRCEPMVVEEDTLKVVKL